MLSVSHRWQPPLMLIDMPFNCSPMSSTAVRQWSDKLVEARKSMNTGQYAMSASALRDDPLSQKIVACGRFLAPMLASGTIQDDPSCH